MRHVILNADDYGYDPAVSRGIREAMRAGVVSSTTFMVNTPSSEAAAAELGELPAGLHLNLVTFSALTSGGPLSKGGLGSLEDAFVEAETEAQLARFEALLGRPPTHLDSHHHAHQHPAALAAVARAAARRSLPVRSTDAPTRRALRAAGVTTNDAFGGDAAATAYWTLETLVRQLDALPAEGVVELMCHPGYAPATLLSGYSTQREVERATFTSPEARAALFARGISLVSWATAFGGTRAGGRRALEPPGE